MSNIRIWFQLVNSNIFELNGSVSSVTVSEGDYIDSLKKMVKEMAQLSPSASSLKVWKLEKPVPDNRKVD